MDPKELAKVAYQQARAALKELGHTDEQITTDLKDLGEKCGYAGGVEAVSLWAPFGGAKSFEELDRYQRGDMTRRALDMLNWQLKSLMNNILESPEFVGREADRAAAIKSVAEEFADRADMIPTAVAAVPQEELATGVREGGSGIWDRVKGFVRRPHRGGVKDVPLGSFTSVKDINGNWRWVAVYTNRFEDVEGEVFPESAQKEYVAWADEDPETRYPELWDWHTPVGLGVKDNPGLGMGKADFLDYQDGLAIAAGYWYPAFKDAAEAYSHLTDIALSHGYDYAPEALGEDGAYEHFFTFEISPLPRARAANKHTLFLPAAGSKEAMMQLRPDRRAHLAAQHGESFVKDLETNLGPVAQKLQEAGVRFKDIDALFPEPTTAPATQPPAATAAASGTSVPSAAGAAAGGTTAPAAPMDPAAFVGAVKEALEPSITAGITAAVAPILTRLDALETAQKDVHAPRYQPGAIRPSEDPANVVNGNTAGMATAVRTAMANQKDDGVTLPGDMDWYRANGLFGDLAAQAAASGGASNPLGLSEETIQNLIAAAGVPQPAAS